MNWLEICVSTDGEAAEAVAEYLTPYAYNQGVVLERLGDPDAPDPYTLEPIVNVKIYLPEDEHTQEIQRDIEEVLYQLGRIYPIPEPTYRILADEDWAQSWREKFKPFRLGKRLWIKPSWTRETSADKDDIVVSIDPGMAFGTGLHPSTQLCLEAIENLLSHGSLVLDVGSGSGILSIAAAKFGARRVVAFDTDFIAARTTFNNVKLNELSKKVDVFQGDLSSISISRWNLIIVNILAPVIISLIEKNKLLNYLSNRGRLILSGIILDQGDEVERIVQKMGGVVDQRLISGDWLLLIIARTPES
ncbi:MAG: 50S ribosomal protein L11 methyltransferase [Anaerolineae bacterium]|nr:MAG: 50S ribosomal protein L11 methyltransferase [Anaerolineae bacterium]